MEFQIILENSYLLGSVWVRARAHFTFHMLELVDNM